MSADNGVYILGTKGKRRRGKEYRVAHAQAIDQISSEPDCSLGYNKGLDMERVQLLFGGSRVFTDRKIAEGYAERIHDERDGCTEYGVVFLDYTHVRFRQRRQMHAPRR